MIPEYLKRNLDLFRTGEYTIVSERDEVISIIEEESEGAATLRSKFEDEAVVFHFPEKRTLPIWMRIKRPVNARINLFL